MVYERKEIIEYYKRKSIEDKKQYKKIAVHGNKIEIHEFCEKPVEILINVPRVRKSSKEMAVLINVHGGAFAEGNAVTMDMFCQELSDKLEIMVVNLNYRLFPAVYCPEPMHEMITVYRYLIKHAQNLKINRNKIGAIGFSAGATIAFGAEILLLQEEQRGLQYLIGCYPMTSSRKEDIDQSSPYDAVDPMLSAAMEAALNGMQDNPICSNLIVQDEIIKKFPQTAILTCGKDSLCAMGKKFAHRLMDNGVSLFYKEYKNAYHGFIEVNISDFFLEDKRRNKEQKTYYEEAEQNIIDILSIML